MPYMLTTLNAAHTKPHTHSTPTPHTKQCTACTTCHKHPSHTQATSHQLCTRHTQHTCASCTHHTHTKSPPPCAHRCEASLGSTCPPLRSRSLPGSQAWDTHREPRKMLQAHAPPPGSAPTGERGAPSGPGEGAAAGLARYNLNFKAKGNGLQGSTTKLWVEKCWLIGSLRPKRFCALKICPYQELYPKSNLLAFSG